MSTPSCQKATAQVPKPVILAPLNSSQNFSCESGGQALSSCLWGHNVNGTGQTIIIDKQVAENDGQVTADGILYAGNVSGDLDTGKCVLGIESITDADFGMWTCTLVSTNSTIFAATIHIGRIVLIAIRCPSESI